MHVKQMNPVPAAQCCQHHLHLLPALLAELVMHIDGHERRWHVRLRPDPKPSRIVPAEFEPI